MSDPMPALLDRRTVFALLFVAVLSWTARELLHQKIPVPERGTWITSDKDSLYHMRRVERAFTEGLPGSDPYLSFPDGSAIPWPPYYTAIAWAWSAVGAPEDAEARRDWIERRVASLPRLFGVATSVLAALAGAMLAGPAGALVAGTSHALNIGSIVTSCVGNGDHHAFIAALAAATLLLMSRALRPEKLADVRGSARRGAIVGALCGVALGAWVAALLHIVLLQLVLAWVFLPHSRRPIAGFPALAIAFHTAASLAVLPAVIASPWKAANPWMVVNLSWFHLAWLLGGGLVFWPLRTMTAGPRLRSYPPLAAGIIGGVALVLFALNAGPAAGIREGFAWLRRDDAFMGAVWESRGLLGEGAAFDPIQILGAGLFVLPLAWLGLARLAFLRGRFEMLPWAVALPILFLQAARQVRFADALAMPMAVALGWGALALWGSRAVAGLRRASRKLGATRDVVLALVLLAVTATAHGEAIRRMRVAMNRPANAPGQDEHPSDLVARELAAWVRAHTSRRADYSVLSSWTWGHLIEWAADRPTVATNFGTFVGAESFRAPASFFLAEDSRDAEAILESRRARYILLTSWLPNEVDHLLRAADPSKRSRYVDSPPGQDVALRFEWYLTTGSRLLLEGRTLAPDGSWGVPIDFARIVHVSPTRDPRLRMRPGGLPAGWVWERVPGAIVEAKGAPGDTLEIAIRVRYASARHEIDWQGAGVAGEDGVARVRVPYATDAPNGDGQAQAAARWRCGRRAGEMAVPQEAVLRGELLRLNDQPRIP